MTATRRFSNTLAYISGSYEYYQPPCRKFPQTASRGRIVDRHTTPWHLQGRPRPRTRESTAARYHPINRARTSSHGDPAFGLSLFASSRRRRSSLWASVRRGCDGGVTLANNSCTSSSRSSGLNSSNPNRFINTAMTHPRRTMSMLSVPHILIPGSVVTRP